MRAAELIERARAAGLTLVPKGEVLRVRGPEPLPTGLLDLLRTHKTDILAYLRESRPAGGIGCARPPDRVCGSCGGGLQPDDPDDVVCGTCTWNFRHLEPRRMQ